MEPYYSREEPDLAVLDLSLTLERIAVSLDRLWRAARVGFPAVVVAVLALAAAVALT